MSRHAALDRFGRSGNPLIRSDAFDSTATLGAEKMTLQGAVNKTSMLLAMTVLTAGLSWNIQTPAMGLISTLGIGAALIAAIATFGFYFFFVGWIVKPRPHLAPKTAPIYALGMGFAVGLISRTFEAQFPGIVLEAVSLTFFVAASMLQAYKTGIIKPDRNFMLMLFAATMGVVLTYLANLIYMWVTGNVFFVLTDNGWMGIGFSLLVVAIAALNLVLDFDIIEQGAERGAPKYIEWFGAMALVMTLIWLYIEILRLLAKLRSR